MATGEGAKSPTDAVENIEATFAAAKSTSEASNDLKFDDDKVNLENIKEPISYTQTTNGEPSIGTRRHAVQDEFDVTPKRSKTNKYNESNFEEDIDVFNSNMQMLVELCKGAQEAIGKLANCFQFMADDHARRMQVLDLISGLGIEGLAEEDLVNVGFVIASDNGKTNFLFSLPDRLRKIYVKGLLDGSM